MANVTRTLLHFVAALLLFIGACSRTVEGEQKAWDSNVTEVKGLMATYPGFKPALEARLASAQAIFDASKSMSGDAQIEKMAEANGAIKRDFVQGLTGLDAKLKKLRESRVEAAAKAGDESSRLGAKVAAQDAAATIERVEATLATGAKDEAGAKAVLDKIHADIDTAQSAVDKVLGADADKKKDADKKSADEAKAKAEAEAKVADWKCEYCGTSNKHDAGKCSSCGAARTESKK